MKLRKLSLAERQKAFDISDDEIMKNASELADVLIETAIGTFPIPLGVATGFLIDGEEHMIPMATEEPSVIAATSYAASLVRAGGGFITQAAEPIITAQIYLKNSQGKESILRAKEKIGQAVDQLIPRMVERGGGFRHLNVVEAQGTLAVSIDIDVREAMGANTANTVAEGLKSLLTEVSKGEILMAVLTNAASKRLAKATFEIPERFIGKESCQRIVEANNLAKLFPERAVTHNKGIMNGISALALATANDTRAIEAAAHFYAQKGETYKPLTSYRYENSRLVGSLEMPLPMATIGGSVSFWPAAQLSLKILKNPSAAKLSQIAVSLGLAQNLAALLALVSEGIQKGHMQLHAAKIAYGAGARGEQVRLLAASLNQEKSFTIQRARQLLKEMQK